ncbi:MAG TPA: Flp pilus assembly protein CpaB [Gaiellaceae bacterium]|nr:Flp pilus assembly protein CpaB [Gaiellaceae bacterium]
MQKLLTTRGGTVAVAAGAALLAGLILVLYLNNYRSSVDDSSEPIAVLVAKSLIPKGMSGDLAGSQELFQATTAPKGEVKDGAITDPATLHGRVAVDDIFPGQQLTAADFSAARTNAIATRITGDQRAVAVPLDEAHGLIGHVRAGDHVDVLAGFNVQRVDRNGVPISNGGAARPVLKRIIEDVLVLDVPEETSSGFGGNRTDANVVLRLDESQAADLAFASDNGKVWFSLRPQSGAEAAANPPFVTLETLLLGVKSVTIVRSFGGRP